MEDELDIRPKRNRAEGYNTRRIYNLLAKDRAFWEMPVHERVLPLVTGLLDKWALLSGTTAMNIGPGEDLQGMHTDEGNITLARPHPAMMVVTIWALTDFTAENGATRLVPGSHKADRGRLRGRVRGGAAVRSGGPCVGGLSHEAASTVRSATLLVLALSGP